MTCFDFSRHMRAPPRVLRNGRVGVGGGGDIPIYLKMNTASSAGKAPARYSPRTPLAHTLGEACMWNSAPPPSAVTRSRCVSAPAMTPLDLCVCVCACVSRWHKNPWLQILPHLGGAQLQQRTHTRVHVRY